MTNSTNQTSSIMFTDIVGYSAMISKDQKHALDLLANHDKIIEPIIDKKGGKIIKKIGDSIFAEFDYALNSSEAAIQIQKELFSRNLVSKPDNQIHIRIGLHTGQYFRKDDDLFGHDVNLCSRIESIAPKGGIAASINLIQSIDKENLIKREMGYVKLKNIPEPLQVYKLYISKDEYDTETSKQLQQSLIDNGVKIVDIDTYKIEKTFSIGVLYIQNLGDESDESVCYTITENLLNDLEYINEVRTSSFNDILKFKQSNLGFDYIARKLEVDIILRGTLLKEGDSLLVSFDLLDTNNGATLWQEKWSELVVDNRKLRKHVLQSILDIFKIELPDKLQDLYSEELTLNREALEAYSKGAYNQEMIKSNEKLEEGKKYFNKAISLDPNFVEAYCAYGLTCHRLGEYETANSLLQKGLTIAQKKKYDIGASEIYNVLSILNNTQGKYEKAREYSEKALEIQVSHNNQLKEAKFRTNYANCLSQLKLIDLAIEQNKIAINIKEKLEENKSLGISYGVLANIYFALGDFTEAQNYGKKALGIFRKYDMTNFEGRLLAIIADSLMQCGNYDEMTSYLDAAEIIIKSFNDFFILGKLEFMKVQKSLYENEIKNGLDLLDNCIDYFEMAENKPFIVAALIEKIKIYIEIDENEKALKVVRKVEAQLQKIEFSDFNLVLHSIKCVLDLDNLKKAAVDEIEKSLNDLEISEKFISYWYLAQAYFGINEKERAQNCHDIAKSLLTETANKNSDKEDKGYFLNNIYFHKRIQEDLKDKSKEIDDTDDTPKANIFTFCPSCGFNNSKQFVFCPQCGQNLKSS